MRELRRKDRALPEALAELILTDGEYGVLATAGKEYPYAVPLNYVYKNGAIYFHSALEGQKLDLLKENPRVKTQRIIRNGLKKQKVILKEISGLRSIDCKFGRNRRVFKYC
ncbi:pyridoxamine 5'-phosphate oxidase family protein [Carboxydothermus pertinax]|uniref:MFS transporter n=1 Tax=Carboxydothermus pertinax TaxID=870242 RepID=A0A1L8CVE1_9THEO|nr:pyridoxamine 5'-phosphate oxidase family protein [Carboxydothermus pertinax]GAV22898.1 MFS transporter [Carboxydothermus pertinax]